MTKKTKKIEKFYEQYSDTEYSLSDILTDRQFYFVDYCVCKVIEEVGKELHDSGEFPLWDEEHCINEVNNALGGAYDDFFGVVENYEEWYDEDENTVISNIYEALDELCNYDRADLIRGDYADFLEGEIKSLKAELSKLKKEEKRFKAEMA